MRGSADPVRELLADHRALCAGAVDPLEIAAGLEASGLTDRAAARFRHRDLFSLAEELYARAAAPAEAPQPAAPAPRRRPLRHLAPLLPGTLCAAALAAGGQRPALAAVLGAAAIGAARVVLFRRRPPGPAALWALPPLGFALGGDAALAALAPGAAAGAPGPAAVALTLGFAAAPAVWCGGWFARRAAGLLAASRGVAEFTARTRGLLAAALLAFLAWLLAVQAAAGGLSASAAGVASVTAAGLLLGLTVLLAAHGQGRAAAAGLASAGAVELLALALAAAAWLPLPGTAEAAGPLLRLLAAQGTAAVPALACGGAALALLAHAARALPRAAAHHAPRGGP
ncbi:hypothetical protein RM780_11985 [Streptomyces sp. DSM 44917]|uniref:Integral membrane protein n=1 Tax=Streptomyces boetiae TaxID=3075541 RepID=A0ABU2L8S1_9ACTN|nr:hypothetical protein [Streptomyces sp. DSM 44917]MDT0307678.1 hypothetical protein [Streptomyces sp. DSM 44917]